MAGQSAVEQLRTVLADQQRELDELRRKRREMYDRIGELGAEEIDILLGIRKTKEALEELKEFGAYVEEEDGY